MTTVETTTATEYARRRADLCAAMAARGWAAVAVTSPENVYFLTGLDHAGYFAFTLLIVTPDGPPMLVTREMERPTVRAQLADCRHHPYADGADPAEVVARELAGVVPAGAAVAVEDESMFFPPAIRDRIRAALPDRRWCDATGVLSAARLVKSAAEIAHVRAAAAVSDAAMRAVLSAARPGVPERTVAAAAQAALLAGGHEPGFAPLIRPLWMLDREHVSWGDRLLGTGGLFIELSGCVRRYHAPLSRTVHLGRPPADAGAAHQRALAGLTAAAGALRPGARTGEVYAAWRRATGATRHHCGYLVGIGFPPSWVGGGEVLGIRPSGDTEVRPGMTFHLMSWVPGHVVSDTALVADTGAELLTTAPRTLTVLD
ncbi:M24 family metallopeptidase [Amycolatopsis arida]|uniref:M24 family metallopeptidase n=1 Tax=Amycolatopsis arida TaxID=587909 RepID=UPI001416FEB4|nr:Xaa-Pro peptidase family protein [Amycolatopsis arida]